jgi:hypothetical protein
MSCSNRRGSGFPESIAAEKGQFGLACPGHIADGSMVGGRAMRRFGEVLHRPDSRLQTLLPLVAFGFALWLGWDVFIAIAVFLAAAIVATILRPRRPGRWTE